MRLTKQLKAQANGLKFASQIVAKSTYQSHIPKPYLDLSTSDGQSKSLASYENDENFQMPAVNVFVQCPPIPDDDDDDADIDHDKLKPTIHNNNYNNTKAKIPMIITTSRSENYLCKEQNRLKTKKYRYDDMDSINSSPVQDEDVML